jgi:hypothetical protein
MVESHDGLLMEIARETGLDRTGEDEDEEEEEEVADDGGDAAAPPTTTPPPPVPHVVMPEEMKKALWRQCLGKKSRCRMRSSWQRLSPRSHHSIYTMRS